MAKLKAPLFSFGASGKIADSLVFFKWKGLNVVRQYVVPANPDTEAQSTHRAYLTAAVAAIHAAQILAAQPLGALDSSAYALLGSLQKTPRTWFNTAVKVWIDQYVADLHGAIYHGCEVVSQDTQVSCDFQLTDEGANAVTEGNFWYGTKKTTLINSEAGVDQGAGRWTAVITGLTNGKIYYVQFKPTAHADYVGANSGIYHGTPHA